MNQTRNLLVDMKNIKTVVADLAERNTNVEKMLLQETSRNKTLDTEADIKQMKQTMDDLAERNIMMEKLLREMAKRQNIPVAVEESRSFL